MTGGMVRVGNADLRVGTIALLARELECDDARDIRLKGENLQVEHQLGVIGERRRDPYRPIQVGRPIFRYGFFGTLDFTLDLTNAVEILIQANAIGSAYPVLELRDVAVERIEQAGSIVQRRTARGRVAALAEQALEDDPRMRLSGKRGRRRRPGEA